MNRSALAAGVAWAALAALTGSAAADIGVIGGLTREVTLQPAGSSEGRILLRNSGDEPQEVKVYPTDYLFYADGRVVYAEPGTIPRSSARWITIYPHQVTVPAGGSDSVSYVIQVPEDANLRGTYWSMVMVEPIVPEALELPKPEEGKVQIGIRTVTRYAVQMVVHIGDTGERKLRFAERQLLVQEGTRTLQLDVENVGERRLVPLLWAELYDQQGESIGRFEGGRLRTYPGCSARFRIDLSEVPAGKYKALVVADCGGDEVFGAQYDMELP